ncbi:MAG TPA: alpha/beta hydrolase [bacterium]|nr:alpha/beta hydrolase [bacterium]
MTAFPALRFVTANGLRMAVYEMGQGMPVVLCHGFPELAFSWRHQIGALAEAGYRVIVPDLRGYGRTERPAEIAAYDIHHLTDDLAGLLDALELEHAVFCGHDWGGIVVWAMPRAHPDRVTGVIGVNTPDLPRPPADPVAIMRKRYGEHMYMVEFQPPGVAEALLEADPARTLRFFFRRHRIPPAVLDDRARQPRLLALLESFRKPESEWGGEPLLDAESLATYVRAFTETGFAGGLNWYRNLTRNWETTAHWPLRIDVPCLMISAEHDVVLRPAMAEPMGGWIADLERHVIADCGHWTQAEQPEALNRLMLDWLRRRFPRG